MDRIGVVVNGLPGNMATKAFEAVAGKFSILPYSLTGYEVTEEQVVICGARIALIKPDQRQEKGHHFDRDDCGNSLIAVDFTHPSAANLNAEFYCQHNLPFVMGTTGGNRDEMIAAVRASKICAVIAPNMAAQIVALQAMMEYAANNFPKLFNGYMLEIIESHQKGKADTSGTAKAMLGHFNQLGANFDRNTPIRMIRDEEEQRQMGVPEEHLGGHGWHTYTLTNGTVKIKFTHNVNGREIYAEGTVKAVRFLAEKVEQGVKGQVFSMIDVLRG